MPPLRRAALIIFAILVVAVVALACFTEQGRRLFSHPQDFSDAVASFAGRHPILSPLLLFAAYTLLSLALLPVWWLQILTGVAFGLYAGVGYCTIYSAIAAILITRVARWVGASEVQAKIEARRGRLQRIMDRLGHNGLLTVMAVRLAHLLPFSLSNHVFALTPLRYREIFIGTLFGNIPAITFYVALGANPALVKTHEFWLTLAVINAALVLPLLLRYLYPRLFRRAGIE